MLAKEKRAGDLGDEKKEMDDVVIYLVKNQQRRKDLMGHGKDSGPAEVVERPIVFKAHDTPLDFSFCKLSSVEGEPQLLPPGRQSAPQPGASPVSTHRQLTRVFSDVRHRCDPAEERAAAGAEAVGRCSGRIRASCRQRRGGGRRRQRGSG